MMISYQMATVSGASHCGKHTIKPLIQMVTKSQLCGLREDLVQVEKQCRVCQVF